jgi:serine/threonine-protein phosphatase 2A activator
LRHSRVRRPLDLPELLLDIQSRYQEAAGSHGVWGIDDSVPLPFVFGCAQLIDDAEITPANVNTRDVAAANRDENEYCKSVDYVSGVKTDSFTEHSRMLWSLRNLPRFQIGL